MNRTTLGRWKLSIIILFDLCFTHLLGHAIIDEGPRNRSCEGKLSCEELIDSANATDEIYWHAHNCDRYRIPSLHSKTELARPFTCFQMNEDGTGIAMTTTCSPGWEGTDDQHHCEDDAKLRFNKNPALIINIKTGVIYPNTYCARCNNEKSRDLIASSLRMACPEESRDWLLANSELNLFSDTNLSWNPNIQLWEVELGGTNHSCVADLLIPESFRHFVRRCDESPVIECPVDWGDSEIRKKCEAYSYLVYAGLQPYLNPHCALCNGQSVQNLTCSTKNNYFVSNARSLEMLEFYGNENYSNDSQFIVYLESDRILPAIGIIRWSYSDLNTRYARNWYTPSGLTTLCHGLSNIFLFLHLIAFILIKDLRDLNGKNLASLCFAILLGNSSLVLSEVYNFTQKYCEYSALLTYYGYLSSFFWLQTIAFDIWHMLKRTKEYKPISGSQNKRFLAYCAWCWLVPAIYIYIEFSFNLTPKYQFEFEPSYFTINLCIVHSTKAIFFMVLPAALIMIGNVIFFLLSAYILYVSTMSQMQSIACISVKGKFVTYAKLMAVMGLNGVLALLLSYFYSEIMPYVLPAFNTFQGIYIFVTFTCSEKGRIGFEKIFRCKKDPERNIQRSVRCIVDRTARPSETITTTTTTTTTTSDTGL